MPSTPMAAAAALTCLGGVAPRSAVLALTTRRELERSVRAGTVHRVAWGRYALPTDVEAQRAARAIGGVAILVSAAAHWGWARQWEPRRPQVAVKRGRRLDPEVRRTYDVRWRRLPEQDVVDGWVTTPVRTVLDCAVLLPLPEALAVADSALRSGMVTTEALTERVPILDRQLQPRVRRVVQHAEASAANPFESVLRAICLGVPSLDVRCQVRIDDEDGWVGRVDLADRRLRIVIEGESLEFHGEREVFDRDCARYSRLAADGWLVLRFSWTQVMTQQEWVRRVIARAVAERSR
jgi:very-short-patch-repair endonuclease